MIFINNIINTLVEKRDDPVLWRRCRFKELLREQLVISSSFCCVDVAKLFMSNRQQNSKDRSGAGQRYDFSMLHKTVKLYNLKY